jgi:peptidoglycan/LPS O-acetylase OafA/YrhL
MLPSLALNTLWSLSVEEQFYLTWPWIVRRLSRRALFTASCAIWFIAATFRFALLITGKWACKHVAFFWFFTLSRLDPIAAGILVAAFLGGKTENPLAPWRPMLALVGIGLICLASALPDFGLSLPAAGLGCGVLLIAAIGARSIARPWLVYLGRISYGLYVFHGAVLYFLYFAVVRLPLPIARLCYPILGMILTIAIAATSYRWFESPFLRMKTRFQYVASKSA